PELEPCAVCDTIDVAYRLPFRPVVTVDDRRRIVPVQVTLRLRLTRCAGPVSVGDLIYSTTLLPGEQVRLFTSDRHSRFTFDSETSLAYRQEATSEESYFAAGMAHAMSNVSQVESSRSASSFSESSVSGGGGAGIDLGIVEIGGSVSGSSYDAQSLSTFARSVSRHAESSSRHVEVATRALSSTSVGEVETRSHREGESEDHFESASRSFANPNRCRALTFLFYKLVKCQQVRFELVAVDLEVLDPAAPTGVTLAPPTRTGGVGVIARPVVATSKGRLEVERAARVSAIEREQAGPVGTTELPASSRLATAFALVHEPLSRAVREAALAAVHQELVEDGLVDDDGEVTEEAQRRFGWTREIALPTPGVLVRGCLDDCDICEPDLRRERELDLQRKELENRLLERRIELLEKSQEYRCCPPGLEEDGEDG
ncbi:MAG TPA: hypothetical protein VHF25_05405, partial [Nitriliruptorales bacterium]|nr:hypothetical protein [Nitriliruptorales bacterium]